MAHTTVPHRRPSRLVRHTPMSLVRAAAGWHVSSQQHARRNALVASTAMAERRRERVEVEEFLAAHSSRTREVGATVPLRVAAR